MRAIYVSAGRAHWLETCRSLARLPALQSFVLMLGSSWFSEPVEKLPVFLEPLRELRIQRSRKAMSRDCRGVDRVLTVTDSDMSSGSSSDEESSSSSSSFSSSNPETSMLPCYYSYSSLPTTTSLADVSMPVSVPKADPAHATWELRLQGQPYYEHELDRLGDDLQRRGIDCYISTK